MSETMILSTIICSYPDDEYENLITEAVLPGVEKKDISFKLTEAKYAYAFSK